MPAHSLWSFQTVTHGAQMMNRQRISPCRARDGATIHYFHAGSGFVWGVVAFGFTLGFSGLEWNALYMCGGVLVYRLCGKI